MLSPSPASCTSPGPDTDNPAKRVQWASEKRRRTSSTDSEPRAHLDPSKLPRSRRPSRLTVKYDRSQLQRWLEMEQWVDAQVHELFQESTEEPGEGQGDWTSGAEDQPDTSEPEIDLEALMELSTDEQKTQLEDILRNCPRPTESFITELLSELKKLRRLSRPPK